MNSFSEEVDNLDKAWAIFQDRTLNGQSSEEHSPPALVAVVTKMFESIGGNSIPDYLMDRHSLITSPRNMINFGVMMFEFGQSAAMNGVLAANLEPCRCNTVTDEEISNLLDGKR